MLFEKKVTVHWRGIGTDLCGRLLDTVLSAVSLKLCDGVSDHAAVGWTPLKAHFTVMADTFIATQFKGTS